MTTMLSKIGSVRLAGIPFYSVILLVSLPAFAAAADTSLTGANETGFLTKSLVVQGTGTDKDKDFCVPSGIDFVAWPDKMSAALTDIQLKVDPNNPPAECHGGGKKLSDTSVYTVNTADFNNSAITRQFIAGALVVPFKYYKWGDGTFSSGGTVGGFLGYRSHFNNVDMTLTWMAFAGPTTVQIPKTTNTGSVVNSNASGFSYGVGAFIEVGSNSKTQIGLAIGRDHINPSANWVNNNHGWIAFQAGYAFY